MSNVMSNHRALNAIAISKNTNLLANYLEKEVTFAAVTTGAVATHTIATITGTVMISMIAVCSADVTGTGTIQVGPTSETDGIIATTTGSTIVDKEIWHDASPDKTIEAVSVMTPYIITEDIEYEIVTNTLTGGTVTFYIFWSPLSQDGNLTIA